MALLQAQTVQVEIDVDGWPPAGQGFSGLQNGSQSWMHVPLEHLRSGRQKKSITQNMKASLWPFWRFFVPLCYSLFCFFVFTLYVCSTCMGAQCAVVWQRHSLNSFEVIWLYWLVILFLHIYCICHFFYMFCDPVTCFWLSFSARQVLQARAPYCCAVTVILCTIMQHIFFFCVVVSFQKSRHQKTSNSF